MITRLIINGHEVEENRLQDELQAVNEFSKYVVAISGISTSEGITICVTTM